jgi:Mobilization protein NikA
VARPQKHPNDRASAAFRIRLTSDERTLLDEKAAAAGVTLSQLIRSAVLGYRLPSPPIVREAMSELPRVGVGVNLNQLTRLAHTTGDMPALAELRAIRGVLEAAVRSALDL